MKLIIGLGNIDAHFTGTRHNSGFAALDNFAAEHNLEWVSKEKFKAQVAEGFVGGQKIILAKPTTYYNVSGEAARAIKDFYKIENADILVVHDELALPFGTLRTRSEGSDAGNNGVKSIIAHVGSDVARLRIGIADPEQPHDDAVNYVLGHFTKTQQQALPIILQKTSAIIREFIEGTFAITTHTK